MTRRFAGVPLALSAAALAIWLASGPAVAAVATGDPAALLVYPLITVDATSGTDTLIQLDNVEDTAVAVRCLYKNPHETSPAAPLFTSFLIQLLANQPVAWRAGTGLDPVAGDGGAIPPLPGPFTGVLRCVAVDTDGKPTDRNALIGSATVERFVDTPAVVVDAAHYDATGFDALPGGPNGDTELVLGGPAAEYAACPESVVLPSFFDGAIVDLGSGDVTQRELATTLTLVTCAQGAESTPAGASVVFTVVNEFGQQLTYSRSLPEQLVTPLSAIDTTMPSLSIFNVNRQGSATGTIRITPQTGSGILAVAVETHTDANDETRRAITALTAQLSGERVDADVVDFPSTSPATCVGDCNRDGMVAINEVITGVTIALGNQPLSACPTFDANGDARVAINELIAAVNNALGNCLSQ